MRSGREVEKTFVHGPSKRDDINTSFRFFLYPTIIPLHGCTLTLHLCIRSCADQAKGFVHVVISQRIANLTILKGACVHSAFSMATTFPSRWSKSYGPYPIKKIIKQTTGHSLLLYCRLLLPTYFAHHVFHTSSSILGYRTKPPQALHSCGVRLTPRGHAR